ncbi:hypothetical protein [Brevibacillus laterosporus]
MGKFLKGVVDFLPYAAWLSSIISMYRGDGHSAIVFMLLAIFLKMK